MGRAHGRDVLPAIQHVLRWFPAQCRSSVSVTCSESLSSTRNRLVGLVKASASRAEDPGFEPRLRRFFFFFFFFELGGGGGASSHTNDLKTGTPVSTLPGTWRYMVSAGTGQPAVLSSRRSPGPGGHSVGRAHGRDVLPAIQHVFRWFLDQCRSSVSVACSALLSSTPSRFCSLFYHLTPTPHPRPLPTTHHHHHHNHHHLSFSLLSLVVVCGRVITSTVTIAVVALVLVTVGGGVAVDAVVATAFAVVAPKSPSPIRRANQTITPRPPSRPTTRRCVMRI